MQKNYQYEFHYHLASQTCSTRKGFVIQQIPDELLAERLFTRSLGYSNSVFTHCNDRLYGF